MFIKISQHKLQVLRLPHFEDYSRRSLCQMGTWLSLGMGIAPFCVESHKLKKRKDAGGAVADGAGSGVPLPIPDGVKDEVKKPSVSEVGVQADIDAKSCHLCFPMEEGYLNEIYQLLDWVARHYCSCWLDAAKHVLYISKRKMMMHPGIRSDLGIWPTHIFRQWTVRVQEHGEEAAKWYQIFGAVHWQDCYRIKNPKVSMENNWGKNALARANQMQPFGHHVVAPVCACYLDLISNARFSLEMRVDCILSWAKKGVDRPRKANNTRHVGPKCNLMGPICKETSLYIYTYCFKHTLW